MKNENEFRERLLNLAGEIEESVFTSQDGKLAKQDNILLIKSTKNKVLLDFLNGNYIRPGATIYLMGEAVPESDLSDAGDFNIIPLQTEGRFDVEKRDFYFKLVDGLKFDAIVFLGYKRHSIKYRNVEEVVALLVNDNVPVFEYLGCGELIEWKSIGNYLSLCDEYFEFIEYVRKEITGKKNREE